MLSGTFVKFLSVYILLALFSGSGIAKDFKQMSKSELDALPKEALLKLPAIELLTRDLSIEHKRPIDKYVAVFLIEQQLYDLRYYLAIPQGKESDFLRDAIKKFQGAIGEPITGTLLFKEMIVLGEKWKMVVHQDIYPPGRFVQGGSVFVSARGTWVFENDRQSSPIQTSLIKCTKSSKECVEVNSSITDGSLSLTEDTYEVTKWTKDEVVAENDSPSCVSYTLTVNLNKKEAHLLRRGKGGSGCAGIATKPQILRLENGFTVGYAYRRERETNSLTAYNPEYAKSLQHLYNILRSKK